MDMGLDRIGKYRIVVKIGEGAMGEVYKAHDPLLNRYVALKTISPALAVDSQFRERFIREAQSAAGLNHPNIITVYDFGEEAGLTYMAMEFLEGIDLREAIRAKTIGHLGRKIEVMEQLCEGVGFAHSRGVIHRDLKPGNIHIQPSGHVKVLDFGLARLGASDMTRTGTVMGTPHYMSPEQLRGQKVDARSDVFSLGAIFYELLSGARAFEGKAMHEVMQRMREDPVPLRRRAAATPVSLAALVERAMARDPAARFKDAAEMGAALVHARDELAGETLAAPAAREDEPAERTLLQAAGETILEPKPRTSIAGTSALDVGRHHEPMRTVRPEVTVGPGPATVIGRRAWPVAAIGAVVVLAAVGGGLLWLRSRAAPAPSAPAAGQDQLGMITDVVVTSKLELARADLDNRNYEDAARAAREALDFDPQNAEARSIVERAEQSQRDLDAAVAAARAAVARNDTAAGKEALSRVLALDRRHPVVSELSQHLDQAFRQQAEEARRQMLASRGAAEQARATASPEHAAAGRLASEAEALFGRGEFTVAAQKFLASRDGYVAAGRAAEAARAAEALRAEQARLAATARPSPTATATPMTRVLASPTLPPPPTPAAAPTLSPTVLPTATPAVAAAVPTPSPSAPLPAPAALPTADNRLGGIERALSYYVRGYESLDVAALGAVMDLTPQQEKGLREAFKAFKSYSIDMSHGPVEFDGDGRARVRVTRQDTVNGRKQPPVRQSFVLAQRGDAWRIVSYAFEK